jgi:hypothetical protein
VALSKFLNREQLHKHQSRSSLQGPVLCKFCSLQSLTSSFMNTLGIYQECIATRQRQTEAQPQCRTRLA